MAKQHHKSINFEERENIEKLLKEGLSCGQIAVKINRSKNGIVCEVRKLGKENYIAKEAERIAQENLIKKYKNIGGLAKKRNKEQREITLRKIENLEMQIDILHDTIKEILKNVNNKD